MEVISWFMALGLCVVGGVKLIQFCWNDQKDGYYGGREQFTGYESDYYYGRK